MKHYYFLSFTIVRGRPVFSLLVSDNPEGFRIGEERVTHIGTHILRIHSGAAYCFMRQGKYPERYGVYSYVKGANTF